MSPEEYQACVDAIVAELDREGFPDGVRELMLEEAITELQQEALEAWAREYYAERGLLINDE
jgi:hypothetical protein